MSKDIKLKASKREVGGSGAARRMRREGMLPGAVHGEEGDVIPVKMNSHDFEQMLHHHTSEYLIMGIEIDGAEPRKVLLTEVQHEPVTGDVIHVDFKEISMTEKIRVGVGIELVGEAEGVVQQGGVLEHPLRELDVECLPDDLVETIDVDVSALRIGDTLFVRDVEIDPKLTVLTDPDTAIAAVGAPRKEEESTAEEQAAEGEEAPAEGEKATVEAEETKEEQE